MSAFREPVLAKSLWQVVNTFGPFFLVCAALYLLIEVSYLATLALSALAAALVVRIFIIQHDCGHYAFFKSRWANVALGTACSIITFTPFLHWRQQHARHHRVWNNLDRRESGVDFYSSCATREEFDRFSGWEKLKYRLIRAPIVSLLILPPLIFLVLYRFSFDTKREEWKARLSVLATNLALAGVFVGLGSTFGFAHVAEIHLPIISLAAIIGVWLFSVQHRFERALWGRQTKWDSVSASLQSSSFLRLPKALQWLTGNIGFHHVHHLNPLIPNYRLEECHDSVPALQAVPAMSFRKALKSSQFILWDEHEARLVRHRLPESRETGIS